MTDIMPETPSLRVAVLMTCHNRKNVTIRSLQGLKAQQDAGASVDLFLVDDGSSDGTSDAVRQEYPRANILRGDGGLYWCGGTRLAFSSAIPGDYDFYLWLNDDTSLYPDAMQNLISTYLDVAGRAGRALIVAGSTRDPETGAFTYGGWRQCRGKLGTNSWKKIPPETNHPIFCDTINGNCVFISREVVQRIGNLDRIFTHSMGDLDYGLRARMKGCQIVIAPGYVGECGANEGAGLWPDRNLTVGVRWKKLLGPKGLPVKEWGVFCSRHKGFFWPLVWLSPYVGFWIKVCLMSDRKAT